MQLNTLKRKTELKKSERVGRGGTRGKTSGRGTKGQNARSGRKKRPEERDIIKKLPKLRGRGKNSNLTIQVKPVVISLSSLDKIPSGKVKVQTLVKFGLVEKRGKHYPNVKILGAGEVKNKLNLSGIEVSAGVKSAIEKAGGTVK